TAGFQGTVFGGRQPIANATVVAYAAGATPGASAAQIGATTTQGDGTFTMTFGPTPATGQLVYVVAKGGDSIGTGTNAATRLLTVAGAYCNNTNPGCDFPSFVNLNELSTVAATATLQNYLQFVSCSTIPGNTQTGNCVAIPGAGGLAVQAATLARLVDVTTGRATSFLAAAPASAPQHLTLLKLDTLANVLVTCVNTTGTASTPSAACQALFDAASFGATTADNTLKVAFLIASSPVLNAQGQAFYHLMGTSPIFTPILATAPSATVAGFWTLGGARYAFVASGLNNQLFVWRFSDLGLEALAGVSCGAADNCFDAGRHPVAVAVAPNGQYVYAANEYTDNVSLWTIGAGGVLNPVTGAGAANCNWYNDPANCFPAGNSQRSITVGPSGQYLVAANFSGVSVSVWTLDPLTGAPAPVTGGAAASCGTSPDPGNCVATLGRMSSVAVSPSGQYLYAANFDDDNVLAWKIGAGGVLTPVSGSPFPGGNGSYSITVDPSGRHVYTANTQGNSVSAWTIGTGGVLTPVAGSPFPAGQSPHSVTVDPSGRYLYTANYNGNDVSVWTLDPLTGAPVPVTGGAAASCDTSPDPDPNNCFDAGRAPYSVTVDPSGQYVYTANSTSSDLSGWTIGGAGGKVEGISQRVAAVLRLRCNKPQP
ncbi:MAG: lactonase family protein, partial [Salinisphaera sp.]|nr:lactonase family protein [Salinisphaera sp.]